MIIYQGLALEQQDVQERWPYKRCACGATYTRGQWVALPLVGLQEMGDGTFLEVRNCVCRSTMYEPESTREEQ